ncbi:MAG: TIR domain-containing protein [Nitrospirota bacterium]|nr:TIR domain-containing protein [Nitrospirota bacterium]
MGGVFINYRRDDAKAEAGRISDRLSAHFGRDRVFMDVAGGIAPGQEFDQVIEKAVASSNALVVVIGKQWLTVADAEGRRRIDDPEDYVRMEIVSALNRGKTVIPVLVQDAVMPTAEQLPDDLDRLSKKQALEMSDNRWDYDSGQLIKALEMGGVEPAVKRPERVETPETVEAERPASTLKVSWKGIVGVVMAVLLMGLFGEGGLDQEENLGGMVLGLAALGFGVAALFDVKQKKAKGRGVAIAGMVLGGFMALAFIGQMSTGGQADPPVITTPPLSVMPTPAPSLPAAPVAPAPEPGAFRSANISGSWRGPDGFYVFQQSGNEVIFELYTWNQVLIAQGAGIIEGGMVEIEYVRMDNTGGAATLQVSRDGRQMTGSYQNLVTGETGAVVLVR